MGPTPGGTAPGDFAQRDSTRRGPGAATRKDAQRSMDRRTAASLIVRLNGDAEQIANRFGLRYRSITAERAGVKRRYGVCYDDGAIKIRLRHAVSGEPLRYSSLVDTLCHELAHLRHFHHGPRFKAFYLELLAYARAQRIYRPTPRRRVAPPHVRREPPRASGPVQLGLF
ncbi:MAG: M48 family metallopeptidase [Myxococcota bacterium]